MRFQLSFTSRTRCTMLTLLVVLLTLASSTLVYGQDRYLVTASDGSLSVNNLATGQLIESVLSCPGWPKITVGQNLRLAFVSCDTYLSVVDLTISREIKRIYGVQPGYSVVTPDGKYLLVEDFRTYSLDWVDLSRMAIVRKVDLQRSLGGASRWLGSLAIVGNKVYVTTILPAGNSSPIAEIGLMDLRVRTINLPAGWQDGLQNNIGFAPNAAATPDGKYLAVVGTLWSDGSSYLYLVNTATRTTDFTVLDVDPYAIVITRDGSDPNAVYGYLLGADFNNLGTEVVEVVDLRPTSQTFGKVLPNTKVWLPGATNLAISTDGTRIVAAGAFAPNVSVLDTGLMRTDPAHAVIQQSSLAGGAKTWGLAVASVTTTPPPNAPTVASVIGQVTNGAPSVIDILGSNFRTGAMVRIGSMSPLPATVVSGYHLQLTVPQFAPAASSLDVIVTNPDTANPVGQQYQSGLLANGLSISTPMAYQPLNQMAASSKTDGSVSILNVTQKSMAALAAAAPIQHGFVFSADGAGLYGTSDGALYIPDQQIVSWKLKDNSVQGTISFSADTLAKNQGLAVSASSPLTGGPVAYVPYRDYTRGVHLSIIDTNAASSTFNQVVATLTAGISQSPLLYSVAATSDGKYVYASCRCTGSQKSQIAIFDVAGAQTQLVDNTTLGVAFFQTAVYVTPDGKSLLLFDHPLATPYSTVVNAGQQIKVFDIGTTPMNPTLVATITGSAVPQAGLSASYYFSSYQVVGNRLFALDVLQHAVVAFNFDRANQKFSQLGAFRVPGNNVGFSLAVSPDGALVYVPVTGDDAIAVLDANLLASGQLPLLTMIAAGRNPNQVAVSPMLAPAQRESNHSEMRDGVAPVVRAESEDMAESMANRGVGAHTTGAARVRAQSPREF